MHQAIHHTKLDTMPLTDGQLRRSLYTAALLALLLPPFVGGTLMGVIGYYPLPEFYFIFVSYSGPYVAVVVTGVLLAVPRLHDAICSLARMEKKEAESRAKHLFVRLPWVLLASVTVYSIFGALSADLSLQSMGYAVYTLHDHLFHQFGLIPVVLLTSFPIFFYFVDHLGRYLGPRGISVRAIPLWVRLSMLGIVTPLLIDSLLIGYYYNRTGYFHVETFVLWLSLIALAVGGTWLAWRSLRQSITPLSAFITSTPRVFDRGEAEALAPLSLDELGVLTARFAGLVRAQVELTEELQRAESLSNALIDDAPALVVVLDGEGRIVRFNRACERISGFRGEEVRGRYPWETVLPPEAAEAVHREAFDALANDPSVLRGSYTNEWLGRSGERRLIEWSNSVLRGEEGRLRYIVAVGIDITERQRDEQSLLESREQLNEAQRIARVGSWSLDLRSNRLEWSDEIFRLFEIDKGRFDASYEAFLGAIHPDDRERVNQAYTESLKTRKSYEITHRLLLPGGEIKYVREACETLYDAEGLALLSRGTVQDITEQRQAEETIELYASVFRYSAEAILITDQRNRIVAVNPALEELTGYAVDELVGRNPSCLASGHTRATTYEAMWRALGEAGHWQGELIDRRKDGSVYPKWVNISVVHNDRGEITHHIASFTDISERKAAEERIYHLAHHDTLTGLYNRFSLEDRLGQAAVQAQRNGERLAVMFIDLDRFKTINDTLGHQVGDRLLAEVANRLRAAVRESDIVARLGGDEFVVVLTGIEDPTAVATVAASIVTRLNDSYQIGGQTLSSSPSIGISILPDDGTDVDVLMRSADTAMYHAKSEGRNNYQFFTAEMNAVAFEGMTLERDLRSALGQGQFALHYQPQVEGADGRISGVEALLRWHHPERGMIPPDRFIPIAEESGLIEAIGEWVFAEASRQLAEWHGEGLTGVRMSINLSARQLRSPRLVERLQGIMQEHAIGAGMVELEITETAAMTNAQYAIDQMLALRRIGIGLSIDDFGTGYSSLAYLKSFPIETLKLDRSFVRDIEIDENDAAICKATIGLAHNLGLKVVAEGVENEAQRAFLGRHGCDTLQGYLFSRPLPAAEVGVLLRRGSL